MALLLLITLQHTSWLFLIAEVIWGERFRKAPNLVLHALQLAQKILRVLVVTSLHWRQTITVHFCLATFHTRPLCILRQHFLLCGDMKHRKLITVLSKAIPFNPCTSGTLLASESGRLKVPCRMRLHACEAIINTMYTLQPTHAGMRKQSIPCTREEGENNTRTDWRTRRANFFAYEL